VFQVVSIASCLVTGNHGKEAGSVLFAASFQLFTLIRSSLNLLFPRLDSPSSINLSSQESCSSPLNIFMAFHWTLSSMFMSLLCWGGQNWTQHSRSGLIGA